MKLLKENERRFEMTHMEPCNLGGITAILTDKRTKIQYLFIQIGGAGGLTPLLGQDGKPLTVS